jgi:threonine aldolase
MDASRLMNAVVARASPPRVRRALDSAWIDFTKGLGAPVGAAIAGSRAFIAEAWRLKQQMGGAMRQAGIIAAGAIALRHRGRLARPRHAKAFARGIAAARRRARPVTSDQYRDLRRGGPKPHPGLTDRLLATPRVRLSVMGETRLRAVTHLDVSRKQVDAAVEAMAAALA